MQIVELAGLGGAMGGYAAAFVAAILSLVLKRPRTLGPAYALSVAGAVFHSAALVSRGLGYWIPPFITYYESVLFGSWLAMVASLVLVRRLEDLRAILAALCPVMLLLMGSAMFTNREFAPLSPTLQSWWLVVHVLFALLAFAGMAVAFGGAVFLFLSPRARGGSTASRTDRVIYKSIILAFIFQMVMLVSGSIWANQAWGRYWGWDPIETFSLLTLVLFGISLHLRFQYGWKGRRMAWFAVLGFLFTIYGIWGVPFFSQSIHLYQGPQGPGVNP